ncbi:MAG: hypothetical protein PQJ47_10555 [Sphaerochaetaceae bacterium]|nr:hypothetical protein [Sphaerochaetaceae bacterium]
MKFHTTASTRIISLLVLLAVSLLVVLLPLSISPFPIDRPFIVNSLLRLETTYGITIETGHIESNIFENIRISDIKATYGDNTFIQIDSVRIDLPWYRLIGRRLFKQPLPVTIENVEISATSKTLEHLLEAADTQSDPLELPDISVSIIGMDFSVDYMGTSLFTVIPSGYAELEQNLLKNLSVEAEILDFNNDTAAVQAFSLTIDSSAVEDGKSEAEVTGSSLSGHMKDDMNADLFTQSFNLIYSWEEQWNSGLLDLEADELHVTTVVDDLEVSADSDSLGVSALFDEMSIENVTVDSAPFKVAFDDFSITGDTVNAFYDRNEKGGTASFLTEVQLYEGYRKIVEGTRIETTFRSDQLRQSLKITGEELSLSDPNFTERMFDISWIDSVSMTNPYLLVSKETGSSEIFFESSSDIFTDISYELPQGISASFIGDGNINIETQEIDYLNVVFEEFSSTLLPFTYSVVLNMNASDDKYPLSFSFDDGENLSGTYSFNMKTEKGEFSLDLNTVPIAGFDTIISHFLPSAVPSIGANTMLSGNVNGEVDTSFTEGKTNSSLALSDILIGDVPFNVATTLLASMDGDSFTVDLATLTTEGFRISYEGSVDRRTLYPRGILEAAEVETGRSLVSVSFVQSQDQQVGYSISTSVVPSLFVKGVGKYNTLDEISTVGTLMFNDRLYPMTSSFNGNTGKIDFNLTGLDLTVDYLSNPSHIAFTLDAFDFDLPVRYSDELTFDGTVIGDLALADGIYLFAGEGVTISHIDYLNVEDASLSLSFITDRNQFIIEDIVYRDEFGTLAGEGEISNDSFISFLKRELNDPKIKLYLSGDKGEQLRVTTIADEEDPSVAFGTVDISGLSLERFSPSLSSFSSSFMIAAVSDGISFVDGEGKLEFNDNDSEGLEGTIDISLLEDGIFLSNGNIQKGNTYIGNAAVEIPFSGDILASFDFVSEKQLIFRDASTVSSLSIAAEIDPTDNLFTWMNDSIRQILSVREVTVSNSNTVLLGMIEQKDGKHVISLQDDKVSIRSGGEGFLEGDYDLVTHEIEFTADDDFLFPMKASGYIDRDFISVELSPVSIDFTYLNALFTEPSIMFEEGTFTGDVLIEGPLNNPQYFGTMSSNAVSVSLFWAPNQTLTVKNPVISLYGQVFTLPLTKTVSIGDDGTLTEGMFSLEADFENWNLSQYRLQALIDDGTISIYVPIPAIDMVIEAEAKGDFRMTGSLTGELLYGDIYVESGLVGFGIEDLPSWYNPKTRTSIDMDFTSGRNVSFVYPNADSPILSAILADNQKFSISLTAPAMTFAVEGDFNLRSGEIYYVQENFYITEGSIIFPKVRNQNIESSEPKINLRARLRKFDADSERIDIYLILQNNSFTDINPRFESIPSRSTNEILQLLGQNLIASNATDTDASGISSVLTAATAATDVISRLGIIEGTGVSFGFSSIIKDSFGLDVFTIRSNLIQNLLLDAIPGLTGDDTGSPFSRYLDNTTIYLGKYFQDELYLQGLLTLRRDTTGERSSFLASDLAIDTELNIEWLNDLATFSFFTQPEELSIFNLFDTMGFSVTKNFEF